MVANHRETLRAVRCDASDVRQTIERHHYLHKWPDPRALPFAYQLECHDSETGSLSRTDENGDPLGVAVFSLLQHHRQRDLFGYEGLPTCWQVLNLARVWISPQLQARRWEGEDRTGKTVSMTPNVFSQMISLCLRRVQTDWIDFHPPVFPSLPYHVTLIVSYCDRAHHHGVGYRASGFTLFGQTSDRSKDVYVRRMKLPRWEWKGIK